MRAAAGVSGVIEASRVRWLALAGLTLGLAMATLPAAAAKSPKASPVVDGTVTRVTDGDSLWLAPAGADAPPLQVRLLGVDAPERCQAWGPQAHEALRDALQGRAVTLKTAGRDPYGRTLGTLTLEGVNVNQWLVAEGHAWSTRVKWDRGPYVRYERMAQTLRRGLHAAGNAEAPWQFRRRHGPCAAGEAPAPAAESPPALTEAAAPPPPRDFSCDGRTRCTQMRSCEEARFFIAACPNTQMDGDGDGIPCEDQWCR